MADPNAVKYFVFEPKRKPALIKRACLKCDKQFQTRARFNRICDTCKSHSTWRAGDERLSNREPQGH